MPIRRITARLLAAERRRRGTPRGSRALTCFWQAVLGLRWFRDRAAPDALARDHGISRATADRYLDEVIMVLADEAPDLPVPDEAGQHPDGQWRVPSVFRPQSSLAPDQPLQA